MVDASDLAERLRAVPVNADCRLTDLDPAGVDFAERDPAQVVAVIEVGDEELETFAGEGARRGDTPHDGLEERPHRGPGVIEFECGVAFLGAGVYEGEVELLIGGMQREEELEDL